MPVAVAHRQGSLLDTKGALADNGISRPYRGRLVRQEAVAQAGLLLAPSVRLSRQAWYHLFEMPIYEYVCASCGHRFEKLVRTTAVGQPRMPCPHCHAASAERIVSSFAVGGGSSSPFPPESAPTGGS